MPKPALPGYHLYRWLWGSLDLFFPPTCGGCGRRGDHLCEDCLKKIKIITPPICEICGQPRVPGLCPRCASLSPRFKNLRSWAIYEGPVQEAVRRLKYRQNISLGFILAQPLIQLLNDLSWDIDLVIPVPLGLARLEERGYNQATLIARPVALKYGLPCETQGLQRVRETRSQVGLTYNQRRENVKNAFFAKREVVTDKNILVIDDVATSSATLDACAAALLSAGAKDIFCLTFARTP